MARAKQASVRRHHAKVTINDVARIANVSPMTVSRVINGESNVRDSTRSAVNAAIKKLGYSPNKAARSLASATQVQIGLLYINPSSSYLSAMLLGVLEQGRQSDTQIVVMECDQGPDAEKVINAMIRNGIDGILLPPPLSDDMDILTLLHKTQTLAATIGTRRIEEDISSVTIDDQAAAYDMTKHLLTLGHRRIGFIKGKEDQLASELRLAGFRDAMHSANLEVVSELVVPGRFSYRSGLEAAEQLLRLPNPPTAIFASNDDMAAATVAVAHRHHIDVPRSLTVSGFDDTLLATAVWPQITTIRQPITDMSHAAIELLTRSVRGRRAGANVDVEHLTLQYELIRRESDAPPERRSDA